MTRLLVAAVLAPFAAWYAWRAVRAVRTGVFELLGQPVTRADAPERFWPAVARQVLMSAMVTTAGCLALLGMRGPSVAWAVGGYVVLYVGMHLTVALFVRRGRPIS
jgi:hypothetical protein